MIQLTSQTNVDAAAGLSSRRAAWRWIPSLYFAEGLPYVVVMIVSVIMYKRLGISNTQIALYTSWLYLPWIIKPLWSPLVDILKSKRWWIVAMQLLIGAGLAGVALTIPTSGFLQYTLAFLWLLAFSSATHDIAADGFYMLGLSPNNQAWFVGIRSTFYRLAMIAGQGFLVMLAGFLESTTGLPDATIEIHAVAPNDRSAALDPENLASTPSLEDGRAGFGFDPQSVSAPENQGSPKIVFSSARLEIKGRPRTADDVKAIVDEVRQWNIGNGFHPEEADKPESTEEQRLPWLESIESLIRHYFGPDTELKTTAKTVGNVGVVYLSLAGNLRPGEDVRVQFVRTSGDKDLRVVEGDGFVVTDANQNVPMAAVVQLDADLDRDSVAFFTARSGNSRLAWAATFYLLAGLFLAFFAYHNLALPRPPADANAHQRKTADIAAEFALTFGTFFRKKRIIAILGFLLFYRFAESQLVKIASLFLLDTNLKGGLALTTSEVGFVYGTVGVVALTIGGILGGLFAARYGLKFWLWWMVLAINLPNAVYVYLSVERPDSLLVINCAVAIEQFGYGFGFTAYMLYMLYVSQGEHETAHFAICTGFMALGMMLPGSWSGWLQELIGYQHFFIWILIATVPSFVVVAFVKIDPEFGQKSSEGE